MRRLQHHADDGFGTLAHLFDVLGQLHPAALAAPAGMDLRLHHPPFSTGLLAKAFGLIDRLIGVVGHQPALYADAVLGENALSLVFVEVHGDACYGCSRPYGGQAANVTAVGRTA